MSLGDLEKAENNYPEIKINIARELIIRENVRVHSGHRSSILYFLGQMSEDYWLDTPNAQMAVDYITMLTDDMATGIYQSLTIPRSIV